MAFQNAHESDFKNREFDYFGAPHLKCNGKPCYRKKVAESVKNKRWKQDRVDLRLYQCKHCNYWHLTHQEDYFE